MKKLHLVFFLFLRSLIFAQSASPLLPISKPLVPDAELPVIQDQTIASHPFSVTGPRGALLGQQDGTFEAWVFPWKIFNDLQITANMQDYPVPINVNRYAAGMEVRPDRTTITYSHANFSIRQIMLAPKAGSDQAGVLVFFKIEAIRPVTFTFSLDPVMQRMWPALSDDHPSPEWVKENGGSGFYVLHLNLPDHVAALAMPSAEPGILPPYQEHSAVWPLQFVLHFDPARDRDKLFPLLMTVSDTAPASATKALSQSLTALNEAVPRIVETNEAYYADLLRSETRIETPDARLNDAFEWAIVSMDQLRIQTLPGLRDQVLTAGFVGSGETTRPGFGWYFGRDALWSLYAIDSCGGFATARGELAFLAEHQRADGKIMHERSQTAGLVNWGALPYQWAAADSTPLFLMAANDYMAVSGDRKFIESLWPNLQRAWSFETSHDSDGDGIYDNQQGTGWVESWIPSMPHQEIYLAVLDEQASIAYARLARVMGHRSEAQEAESRAHMLGPHIEQEYYLPELKSYAFSRNSDSTTDRTATIFPSVAWWDGDFQLQRGEPMFKRWASKEFSTDWGTRILSDGTPFYDPISYHQGTVWPLFTGWVSVAEYRANHPLSGYLHLMQNANLTWAGDPGNVTELLSGEFYQPLGRSTAHQLWSSAMVVSPILRGLFGIEWDAEANTLYVTPHLPAEWSGATLHSLPFADSRLRVTFARHGDELLVTVAGGPPNLHLASHSPGAKLSDRSLSIPLPAVEIGVEQSLPEPGSVTSQLKVLEESYEPHKLTLHLAAPGNSQQILNVRENDSEGALSVTGAVFDKDHSVLRVSFPPGRGYVDTAVTLAW